MKAMQDTRHTPILDIYLCILIIGMTCFGMQRYKGSNTGKRARRKNLRHPRERFLVSNEALPSWRPIEIFPAGG